jgi:hypothetical protein
MEAQHIAECARIQIWAIPGSRLTIRSVIPRMRQRSASRPTRECAAAHEVEAVDVDDEHSRLRGDCGRLGDQPVPGVLVGGIDFAAGAD